MSKVIAGIDLGTTFSAIAVLNQIGRPEIVPNCDGDRITPSALFFLEDEPGKLVTGIEAINSRHDNSERCVRWIKREMGNPDFRLKIDENEWRADQLSAAILKKLKLDADTVLGEEVEDVVITVPANFGEIARQATMDAGKMAGLNVLGLVNEPTAAAVYYAVNHSVSGRVMIFDLGGGTFDVSIADVSNYDVEVVCSLGDRYLGGRNFDEKLLEYCAELYREETGGELYATNEDRAEVEDYLEEIKKSLSRRPVAKMRLMGDSGPLRTEISREKFDSLLAPILAKIDLLIDNVFEESDCQPSDITDVILAGGSSRVPCVQTLLGKKFDKEPVSVGNMDECVALGAALCAGLRKIEDGADDLSAGVASGLADVTLSDVCNQSYGTTALQKDPLTGKPVVKNIILIPKNSPIPCEVSQVFLTTAENQVSVSADVTQGEGEDINHVKHLARDFMELPPGRPAGQRIKITFSYDADQRMHCVFEDVESGSKKTIQIDPTSKNPEGAAKPPSEEYNALNSLIIE